MTSWHACGPIGRSHDPCGEEVLRELIHGHENRDRSAIDHAIEVFTRGFCFTRSFTHPYVAERIDPLWVMREAAPADTAEVFKEKTSRVLLVWLLAIVRPHAL